LDDSLHRASARTFRELTVWQKAHTFVLGTYALSATFPKHEAYGLTTQLRRAAVSVPANIAEGFKRHGRADKVRFLNIAEASLEEARYYLLLAKDLSYAHDSSLEHRADEIARLIFGYVHGIRNSAR
jgi:four helix bundle protein